MIPSPSHQVSWYHPPIERRDTVIPLAKSILLSTALNVDHEMLRAVITDHPEIGAIPHEDACWLNEIQASRVISLLPQTANINRFIFLYLKLITGNDAHMPDMPLEQREAIHEVVKCFKPVSEAIYAQAVTPSPMPRRSRKHLGIRPQTRLVQSSFQLNPASV